MPTRAGLPTKREQKRLITILKEDFHFDIISEMVGLYHKVKRSRMSRKEKYRFEFQVLSKLMEYALPKLKVEERSGTEGDKILFNIMIGSDSPMQTLPGNKQSVNSVQIPTKTDADGNFVIDIDKHQ